MQTRVPSAITNPPIQIQTTSGRTSTFNVAWFLSSFAEARQDQINVFAQAAPVHGAADRRLLARKKFQAPVDKMPAFAAVDEKH